MPDPQTFDAFYAASVHRVTSHMHAQTNDDPQADHAIREAYARAYQQWYEVSGYPDPEAWVLKVAQDSYQRRAAETPGHGQSSPPAADPSTWPGIYRPRAADVAAASAAAGSDAVAGRAGPLAAEPVIADPDSTMAASAAPVSPPWGPSAPPWESPAGSALPTTAPWAPQGGSTAGWGALAGGAHPSRAGGRGTGAAGRLPGGFRNAPRGLVLAIAAVVLVAVVAVGYLAFGRTGGSGSAGPNPTVPIKVQGKQHMLPAGRTGNRSAVPWSLIGPGWTLAELSTAPPSSGGPPTSGRAAIYLIDPLGGKYLISSQPTGESLLLLGWSGNAQTALYRVVGGGYGMLNLPSGTMTALNLPSDVAVAGFTRPDGLNLLALRLHGNKVQLVRYDLHGVFQASLNTMSGKSAQQGVVCGYLCAAISSPNGDTVVWGMAGNEMRLVSNAGGLVRKLHVPNSGHPSACSPIEWWDAATILAKCAAPGQPDPASQRLWLIPADGSAPTPLTAASGTQAGTGFNVAAWQADGGVYVNQTTSKQCPTAPSGPGGLDIDKVGGGGTQAAVTIGGTTNNSNLVVAAVGGRLLVLAQTSCPGTYSLLWYTPSSGASQLLLTAPSSQVGVVTAVPFGSGPPALSAS